MYVATYEYNDAYLCRMYLGAKRDAQLHHFFFKNTSLTKWLDILVVRVTIHETNHFHVLPRDWRWMGAVDTILCIIINIRYKCKCC